MPCAVFEVIEQFHQRVPQIRLCPVCVATVEEP